MERLPGSSPEHKQYGKYVPFEDVSEHTGGRIQVGIRLPRYVNGTLGVDVDRMVNICDFANIGNIVIAPQRKQTVSSQLTTGSINPDGSTIGFKVQETQSASGGVVIPRSERQSVAIKDCIVEIPTKQIMADLSRRDLSGAPQDMRVEPWQKAFDMAVIQGMKELPEQGLYGHMTTDDRYQLAMIISNLAWFIPEIPYRDQMMPPVIGLSLFSIALTQINDWIRVFRASEISPHSARYLFTFLPDSKRDRRFLYGRKLSKPGLVGIINK